uniref:NAD(P)H-dependent nitrite reductase n=1 Tax=Thiocapsa roseopersicina TaxID=1058 RepID=X5FC31_THIRO|nr:NAD(P)H-dependent nitrite reductase [Thiocapsa roseopersicina]
MNPDGMNKERLVLVGNGMAGMRTIVLKLEPDLYEITVFGAEPHPNYNRILLSPVLSGEKTIDEIILNSLDWYAEHGITLHTGDPVEHIDRRKRLVRSRSGLEVPYDRLILATGSNPFIIPVPGADLPGVLGYRDIADVEAMIETARGFKRAIVIGGGLLGLEAAYGLQQQDMEVTVVHLLDTLMERQLDKPAAALLKASLEQRGLTFLMEAQNAAIQGRDRVESVRFADGSEVATDLVVMAVGIRPNMTLAQSAGIHCERGIVVDDTMLTYDARIYAIGECVQHRGQCYGLVAPLFEQAKVCPNHLAKLGYGRYQGSVTSTKLKVTGIDLFSAGQYARGRSSRAITSKGLFTLEDVKLHTKAAASCGSCTGLVEQILASTLGSDYSTPEAKPICTCTDYSHDQVRAAIREQHLTSLSNCFEKLDWRQANGCHICRPALNYYLISTWPADAIDDSQSRFVNERVHANIQKDGTYSVIPRIFGGETSPAQLRAIAEAAEKYAVRSVKITGGQRIDLLGLSKEQLPHIWKDLTDAGFVSGHAYGKSMRTVKICVGSQWCRFGVQDSTKMGIELEELNWGSWTPHKFKLAVSGCPRNCAEATIKDFGVIAIESGWELHIGGNGGVKVRATDVLCRVTTPEQVKEYCGAFMQLYREEARYLERTAPWVERVGLAYIKKRIVEDEIGRRAFYKRFLESQTQAQVDPWKARAAGAQAHEFTALKQVNG